MATFIKDLDCKRPCQIEKRLYELNNGDFIMVSLMAFIYNYQLSAFRSDKFGNVLDWGDRLFYHQSKEPGFDIDKIVNDYEDSL